MNGQLTDFDNDRPNWTSHWSVPLAFVWHWSAIFMGVSILRRFFDCLLLCVGFSGDKRTGQMGVGAATNQRQFWSAFFSPLRAGLMRLRPEVPFFIVIWWFSEKVACLKEWKISGYYKVTTNLPHVSMASNEATLVENAVSKLYYLQFMTHSKFLRLHFQPFGSSPTTLSRAERGTSHVT